MVFTNAKCIEIYKCLSLYQVPSFDSKAVIERPAVIPTAKFMIDFIENKKKLKEVIETIKRQARLPEKYEDFLRKREEINRKYAKKDKDGNPVIEKKFIAGKIEEAYAIPETDKSEYEKRIADLKKRNSVVIKEAFSAFREEEEMLNSDSGFVPVYIDISDVPHGISTDVWDGLFYLIRSNKHKPTDGKKITF